MVVVEEVTAMPIMVDVMDSPIKTQIDPVLLRYIVNFDQLALTASR